MTDSIKKANNANQVLIRIYFIDDTHKTLSIDPNETTGDQLWELMSDKLGINNTDSECFFIWAQNDEIEWLLYNHQKISEVIDHWSILKKRYCVPATPSSPSSPSASSSQSSGSKWSPKTLARKPTSFFNNSSSNNKKSQSMSTTVAIEHASKLCTSFPTLGEEGLFKLVYRPTSVLPLPIEKSIVSSEATHLFYIQAIHNVIQSNYPCDEDIALKLASIQLQVSVGDQKAEHQNHFKESIERYIPSHLLSKHKPEEWESLVSPQHVLLRGSDPLNLKRAYLETCQRWLYYGSTFFKAKYVPVNTSFFLQEYEGKVSIGVNGNGVHIIDPKAMKMISHHYKDIIAWNSTPNSFSLQIGTHIKSDPVKIYTFTTLQGELINDLIHDWLVEWQREVNSTKQQQPQQQPSSSSQPQQQQQPTPVK
eukprot:gene461-582_t